MFSLNIITKIAWELKQYGGLSWENKEVKSRKKMLKILKLKNHNWKRLKDQTLSEVKEILSKMKQNIGKTVQMFNYYCPVWFILYKK